MNSGGNIFCTSEGLDKGVKFTFSMQMKEPHTKEPSDSESRVIELNESMNMLDIVNRSDGDEQQDRARLGKAKSMILDLESPFTDRGLYTE